MKKVIPHLTIILSGAIIVFIILDWYNPLMNFQFNYFSKIIIDVLCVVSFINAIYTIKLQGKDKNSMKN